MLEPILLGIVGLILVGYAVKVLYKFGKEVYDEIHHWGG